MDAFVTRKRRRSIEVPEKRKEPSISPPPKRNAATKNHEAKTVSIDLTQDDDQGDALTIDLTRDGPLKEPGGKAIPAPISEPTKLGKMIPSPIQLNHVDGLPTKSNVDTLRLSDILGDPLVKECWLFNYLFDIDFVMKQFDPDTRDSIRIHVVHGSWKAEDRNGIGIIDGADRYPNIRIHKAYLPDPFGTHHSKAIVLVRHDNLAQVIILTANLIERDWIMSQAIWRSTLLPLLPKPGQQQNSFQYTLPQLGTGARFKHDLLSYFRGYGPGKLQDLISQLQHYDFSAVKGALMASVPGSQSLQSLDPEHESLWGWPGLKRILGGIPSHLPTSSSNQQPHIITQISSVAAVGEKWLSNTLIPALSTSATVGKKPKVSIVFPTADEIRRSVTGYQAGASIHIKTSSPAQAKQLAFLRPMLCHWAGDRPSPSSFFGAKEVRQAGRRRAAPHIKTYIRFSNTSSMDAIDWAMVTSANLSTQAWGGAAGSGGEVRICSYELGVVVWPDLWDGQHQSTEDPIPDSKAERAVMVPVFKTDPPTSPPTAKDETSEGDPHDVERKTIGWRMPYGLPLVPYETHEMPWCASEPCSEPDWMGRIWPGYGK